MIKGIILASVLFSQLSIASQKTICGMTDDRKLSFDSKIGRLSLDGQHKGCTVTMISKSCAITAGHCGPVLEVAEFNTPISQNAQPQASRPEDTYKVDKTNIAFLDQGPGQDWAVIKILPNEITGQYAGNVQGFYNVSFKKPRRGSKVVITGYGVDRDDETGNFAQQIHSGRVLSMVGSRFEHTVDTMGGNSGSTIILEKTQEVIGIHTHGGCTQIPGSTNAGTIIAERQDLQAAIKTCLDSDI